MTAKKAHETIQAAAIQIRKDTGMPAERAGQKAENTYVGKIAVKLGMGALTFSAGMVVYMLVTRQVTWLTVLLALVFAGVGLACLGLGFSLIARDAAPMVAAIGDWLKNFIMKLLRLKINGDHRNGH